MSKVQYSCFSYREKTDSLLTKTQDEDIYNENMLNSLRNVQTAAELCGTSAITALKITAFVPPNILQKLNQILEEDKTSATTTSILDVASKNTTVNYLLFDSFISQKFVSFSDS